MSVTITFTVACKAHPEYIGTRRPSKGEGGCYACWDVYDLRHLKTTFDVVEQFKVHK